MTTYAYFLEILIKVPPSEKKKNLETLPYSCSWVFYLHLGNLSASQGAQWQRIHLSVQETQETWVHSQGLEDLLEKEMHLTPVFLFGKFDGQRSMVGYILWGCKELCDCATEHACTSWDLKINFSHWKQ